MCNYISKAEAINTILGVMQNGESNMEEIFNTALRKAASRIETIPAADVAPVVHGRWVATYFPDCVYARCDQCRVAQIFYYGKPLTTYCPNCGARMDGGEKDAVG